MDLLKQKSKIEKMEKDILSIHKILTEHNKSLDSVVKLLNQLLKKK